MVNRKPHVVAFEGLFSYWPAGYVRNGLLKPLAERYPDRFTYEIYSWFWGRPKMPTDRPIIVVGHSFGGKRAVEFCNENEVFACLTIDPRMQPPRIKDTICFNFYQTGFMHGFEVENAANTELFNYSHTQLPKSTFVRDKLVDLLGIYR